MPSSDSRPSNEYMRVSLEYLMIKPLVAASTAQYQPARRLKRLDPIQNPAGTQASAKIIERDAVACSPVPKKCIHTCSSM